MINIKLPFEERIRLRKESLKKKVHSFSEYYLDEDIEELCCKLLDIMAQQDDVMFMQGKPKNWASAVIYLVARENYMFKNMVFDTLDTEQIDEFFNSHAVFYIQLAHRIDKKLHISENEEFHVKDGEDLDYTGHFYMDDDANVFFIEHCGIIHRIC